MALPFGLMLLVVSFVSMIWGIACAVVGGMLRFNLAQHVNDYISDVDYTYYDRMSKGMISPQESYETVDLGESPKTIGIMAIVVGVLVIIYSLVGLAAGLLKQTSLLFLLIGCVLVSTMLQFVIMWMIVDVNSSFHDTAKNSLGEKIYDEYNLGPSASDFSKVLNSIMLAGQCCGARGPNDFKNLTFTLEEGLEQSLLVSPACCKRVVWEKGFDALIGCGLSRNKDQNNDGCYNTVFDDAFDGQMGTYFILLIIIIIWQCFVMGIGVLMLFSPIEEEVKEGGVKGHHAGGPDEVTTQETEVRTFTPFSKLSSFQHSEITKIKSTEIW